MMKTVKELIEARKAADARISELKEEIKKTEGRIEDLQKELKKTEQFSAQMKDAIRILTELSKIRSTSQYKPYVGVSQRAAVNTILNKSKGPLKPEEITQKMQDGGYHFRSKNPLRSVRVLLTQMESLEELKKVKTERGMCYVSPFG